MSFHQGEGKHLVRVTSPRADINSRTGKYRVNSILAGTVQRYPLITIMSFSDPVVTWATTAVPTVPKAEQMTRPIMFITTCPRMRRGHL